MKKPRRLLTEPLECRRVLAASMGWDGPGAGSAELSYYLGAVPSYLDQTQVEAAIERALNAWSDIVDIRFTRAKVAGSLDSLDFSFRTLDGPGGTLAQAYFPDDVNPGRIAGDVQFDLAERWEIGNALGGAAFDLVAVAVHEIGHALGLDHLLQPDSVLAPSISANEKFDGLMEVDRSAIRALYAPAKTTDSSAAPSSAGGKSNDEGHSGDTPELPTRYETPAGYDPGNGFRWRVRLGGFPSVGFRFSGWGLSNFGRVEVLLFAGQRDLFSSVRAGSGLDNSMPWLPMLQADNSRQVPDDLFGGWVAGGGEDLQGLDLPTLVVELIPRGQNADSGTADTKPESYETQGAPSPGGTIKEEPRRYTPSRHHSGDDESPASLHTVTEQGDCPQGLVDGQWLFGSGSFLQGTVDSIFDALDMHGDAALTQDEVPECAWRLLTEYAVDSDTDRQIRLYEINAALSALLLDRFHEWDTNGDALLTEDDWSRRAWVRIARADTDKDAAVSLDEFDGFPSLSTPEKVPVRRDGRMTPEDVANPTWQRLSRRGAHQQVVLSDTELTAGWTSRSS